MSIVMGRSTKYKEEYLRIAEVVCEEGGLSLRQLGKVLGVSAVTISMWKKKYPEFGDAVDRGCQAYDKRCCRPWLSGL
jgi:transposase